MQVTLSLGDQSIQVPYTDIETIPFFAVYFKRWTSSTQMVLPDIPELKDLLLLKQLVAYCSTAKEDQLPDHFMVTFKLIRMADFLVCDTFLENTAKQLGTSVHKINNSNSIKTVREYVRSAYRWAAKSAEKNQEQFCSVCKNSLAAQFPRLPILTTMVCCKLKIHVACLSNFSTCPCCSQPYQLLPCCVCRGAIEVEPGLSHCEVWLKYRHNRTKCCGADMHESCRKDHFLIYYNRCPICQVPLKQGQPDFEDFEVMDFIYMRSQQNKNNEFQRKNKHYFMPSPFANLAAVPPP